MTTAQNIVYKNFLRAVMLFYCVQIVKMIEIVLVGSKNMSHIPYFPGGSKIWLIFTGNHLGYGLNQ